MSSPIGHLPIPRAETGGDPYPNAPDSAFWLWPNWTGNDNLRDPGTEPFWTRPSARPQPKVPTVRSCVDGSALPLSWGKQHSMGVRLYAGNRTSILSDSVTFMDAGDSPGRYEMEHQCTRFETLWTGWHYCVDCEKGSYPKGGQP